MEACLDYRASVFMTCLGANTEHYPYRLEVADRGTTQALRSNLDGDGFCCNAIIIQPYSTPITFTFNFFLLHTMAPLVLTSFPHPSSTCMLPMHIPLSQINEMRLEIVGLNIWSRWFSFFIIIHVKC